MATSDSTYADYGVLGSDGDEEAARELASEEEEELEDEEDGTAAESDEEPGASLSDEDEEGTTRQDCIISDPSFSMVAVQREDSGITWETHSSGSSTPWASEESQTSGVYSPEGSTVSSPPGNVSFAVGEVKKGRRRAQRSKAGSPSLRRKGTRRKSLADSQAVPTTNKDSPLIAGSLNAKKEQSSAGLSDRTRKKTTSNTPPITGAIYKEHKPLVLRPVYIGTVQYKIKMFNSVKEELIPLQFYGTLPKGYIIKEIHYRKGKEASISLEPDMGNREAGRVSHVDKVATRSLEDSMKEPSPSWRNALPKGRPAVSSLTSPEDQKERFVDAPLRTTSEAVHTGSGETQLRALPSVSQQLSQEAKAPTTGPSPPAHHLSMFLEPAREELEPGSAMAASGKDSKAGNSPVEEGRKEEMEDGALEAGPPGLTEFPQEAMGPDEEEPDLASPEPAALESEPWTPPHARVRGEPGGHPPESPAVEEAEEKEPEPSLLLGASSEPEDLDLAAAEEVIELEYPDSPLPSEQTFPPRRPAELEPEDQETQLSAPAAWTRDRVALAEEEREERESVSTDSAFVSEFSVPRGSQRGLQEEEEEPEEPEEVSSPPADSEPAVWSEEESEAPGWQSPLSSIMSPGLSAGEGAKSGTPEAEAEAETAWDGSESPRKAPEPRAPLRSKRAPEPLALPGQQGTAAHSPAPASQRTPELSSPPLAVSELPVTSGAGRGSEPSTQDAKLDPKYASIPQESSKEIIDEVPQLTTKGVSEHVILSEEKADAGPNVASVPGHSLAPGTPKKSPEGRAPLPPTATLELPVPPGESPANEPFTPASKLAPKYAVPPNTTQESQKEIIDKGSEDVSECVISMEEKQDARPQPLDSKLIFKHTVPPHATQESEKEVMQDMPQLRSKDVSEQTILSEEDTKPHPPDSKFVFQHTAPLTATQESQKEITDEKPQLRSKGVSAHAILSEKKNEDVGPVVASVSEHSLPQHTPERVTECQAPAEAVPEEPERYIPSSLSTSTFSAPPELLDEEIVCSSPVKLKGASSEQEREDVGPFSPDSAFVSEFSFPPSAAQDSERRGLERDSPVYLTSPSDHMVFSDEDTEDTELFSPDSASQVSLPPYRSPETENEIELGCLITGRHPSSYPCFPGADQEDGGSAATTPVPEHFDSLPEQDVPRVGSPPPSTTQEEEAEMKPDAQITSTSVSEYLIRMQQQAFLEPESAELSSETEKGDIKMGRSGATPPPWLAAQSSVAKEEDQTVLPASQHSLSPASVHAMGKELEPKASDTLQAADEQTALPKVRETTQAAEAQKTEPQPPHVPRAETKLSALPGLVEAPKKEVRTDRATSAASEPGRRVLSEEESKAAEPHSSLKETLSPGPEISLGMKKEMKYDSKTMKTPSALSTASPAAGREVEDLLLSAVSASSEEVEPTSSTTTTSTAQFDANLAKVEIGAGVSLATHVEGAVPAQAEQDALGGGLFPPAKTGDVHAVLLEAKEAAIQSAASLPEANLSKGSASSEAEKGIKLPPMPHVPSAPEREILPRVGAEEVKPGLPLTEMCSEVSEEARVGDEQSGLPSAVHHADHSQKKQLVSVAAASGPAQVLSHSFGSEIEREEAESPLLQTVSPVVQHTVPEDRGWETAGSPEMENVASADSALTVLTTTQRILETSAAQGDVLLENHDLVQAALSLEPEKNVKPQKLPELPEAMPVGTEGIDSSSVGIKQAGVSLLGKSQGEPRDREEETKKRPVSTREPSKTVSNLQMQQEQLEKAHALDQAIKSSGVSSSFADEQDLGIKQLPILNENLLLEQSNSMKATESADVKEVLISPKDKKWTLAKPENVASEQEERRLGPVHLESAGSRDHMTGQLQAEETWLTKACSLEEGQVAQEPTPPVLAGNVETRLVEERQPHSVVGSESVTSQKADTELPRPREEEFQEETKLYPAGTLQKAPESGLFPEGGKSEASQSPAQAALELTNGCEQESHRLPAEKPLGDAGGVPPKVIGDASEGKTAAPAMKTLREGPVLSPIPAKEEPQPPDVPDEAQKPCAQPKAAELAVPEEKAKKGISSFKSWMSSLLFGSSTPDNKVAKKDVDSPPSPPATSVGTLSVLEGESPTVARRPGTRPVASVVTPAEAQDLKETLLVSSKVEALEQAQCSSETSREDSEREEAVPCLREVDRNSAAPSAGGRDLVGIQPSTTTCGKLAIVTDGKRYQKPAISPPSEWTVSLQEEPRSDQKEKSLFSFGIVDKTPQQPKPALSDFTSKSVMEQSKKPELIILQGEEPKGIVAAVEEDRLKSDQPESISSRNSEQETKLRSASPAEEKGNTETTSYMLAEEQVLAERQEMKAPLEFREDKEIGRAHIIYKLEESKTATPLQLISQRGDHKESSRIVVGSEQEKEEVKEQLLVFSEEKKQQEGAVSMPEESDVTLVRSLGETESFSLVKMTSMMEKPESVISEIHPEMREAEVGGAPPQVLEDRSFHPDDLPYHDKMGKRSLPTEGDLTFEKSHRGVLSIPSEEKGLVPVLEPAEPGAPAEDSEGTLDDLPEETKSLETPPRLLSPPKPPTRASKELTAEKNREVPQPDWTPEHHAVHTVQAPRSSASAAPTPSILVSRQHVAAAADARASEPLSPARSNYAEFIASASAAGADKVAPPKEMPEKAKDEELTVTSKPAGLLEDQKSAFSIISEGCEILNIHAPAFIPSVDQEESEHMQDKLEYLVENVSIKTVARHEGREAAAVHEVPRSNLADTARKVTSLKENEQPQHRETQEQPWPEAGALVFAPPTIPSEEDYFEKYTLIDYNISPDPERQQPPRKLRVEEELSKEVSEETMGEETVLEQEYDLVQLDESFYGLEKDHSKLSQPETQQSLLVQPGEDVSQADHRGTNSKAPGMPLFDKEEGVLSRTQIFPTSIKAVNPELLEQPPALAFLYKDLYDEAVGERKQEEETASEGDSVNSEASFPSRKSENDDGTGMYFEKYILKDDILHDTSALQKDQGQGLEDKPTEKDESYQLIAAGREIWGRFGTVLRKKSLEEEQRAVYGEGEAQGRVETPSDAAARLREVPVVEEVTAAAQEMSYAVPFVDTPHALAPVEETSQGSEAAHAGPESGLNVPVQVSFPEEESASVLTHFEESAQEEPQRPAPPEPSLGRLRNSPVQDEYPFAEPLGYAGVSSGELSSEAMPRDAMASEGQESLEWEVEQNSSAKQDERGRERTAPDHVSSESAVEKASREPKRAQVDTYCYTCKSPISALDQVKGTHTDHEVCTLDTAISAVKVQLAGFLENLQEKSLRIEAFVSEIESFFNTVEENCSKNEKRLEELNEQMMKKVLAQYDEKAQGFEELKRRKMEFLHDQMVRFLQSMDSAKDTLESIVREAEELDEAVFLTSFEEINDRLLSAMENTASLENIPAAFSLFEHYDDGSSRSDQSLKQVAVPQPPRLEPQEPNSATSTTIAVYWSRNKEDVIDSFQVYCMEGPQDDQDVNELVEEYRLTVKESCCIFEDLEPDRCYQVWVMAVNFTGCSLPSERAIFRTAPSTPVLRAEDCTVCWNMATIRWRPASPEATETYTLEYCRQHCAEGEGLRSFSGIKGLQLRVNLQPNENYFFYVRAANAFGTSEQSEAALVSTRGTRFLLLRETAHPALQISSDSTVISFAERRRLTEIPSVLGEELPACGQHYWEATVTDCPAYRLGICLGSAVRAGSLGQGDASWYMHCSEPYRYTFFYGGIVSDVHVTEHPARVGLLLDYVNQRLAFVNAESGQVLFIVRHRFTEAVHPAFALEKPGRCTLHLGVEPPDSVRHK